MKILNFRSQIYVRNKLLLNNTNPCLNNLEHILISNLTTDYQISLLCPTQPKRLHCPRPHYGPNTSYIPIENMSIIQKKPFNV